MERPALNGPEAQDDALLRDKINLETAPIAWQELQRHHAAGNLLSVDTALDLVDVAFQMSRDHGEQVAVWMETGQLGPVSDAQALAWFEAEAQLWAVVVRPFVLVQQH